MQENNFNASGENKSIKAFKLKKATVISHLQKTFLN